MSEPTSVDIVNLRLLVGSRKASADMPWGRPGPIRLPDAEGERLELCRLHRLGLPGQLWHSPASGDAKIVNVDRVSLAVLCPRTDRTCGHFAIDLDLAPAHANGLLDVYHAARCIVERADSAYGLTLFCSPTKSGGARVWGLIPSTSCSDTAKALALLMRGAYLIADEDCLEGIPHAFRTGDGGIGLGSGAVELTPAATEPPESGWAMRLPREIVDPFLGHPIQLEQIPEIDPVAWAAILVDARKVFPDPKPRSRRGRPARRPDDDPLRYADKRTLDFLDGKTPEGQRSKTAFASACCLLGLGIPSETVEYLIVEGGRRCSANGSRPFTEHEALAAVKSARRLKRK